VRLEAVHSLETDFYHGIKGFLKVAHVRVLGAVDALHVDHLHFRADGKQSLVPGVQADIDPDAPITQKRFDLCEIFGLGECCPWWCNNDKAGFPFKRDQGLCAVLVVIQTGDLIAAIAHVDDTHAECFIVPEFQTDLILAYDLAKRTKGFTRKGFGFDVDNLHDLLSFPMPHAQGRIDPVE
jgi:hypothetical protein